MAVRPDGQNAQLRGHRAYNAFPWPTVTPAQEAQIRRLAQAVLDARAKFPGATLADLYDVDVMRPELRKAHRQLDEAVGHLYRTAAFSSDRERVEHLFGLYENLVTPLLPAPKQRLSGGGRPSLWLTGRRGVVWQKTLAWISDGRLGSGRMSVTRPFREVTFYRKYIS